MPALVYGAPFEGDDENAEYWQHVDDVGAKEFKHWFNGRKNELYRLVRPNDLFKRAQTVRKGDQLRMIDTSTRAQRERLFDITEAVPTTRPKGLFGNVFLVKLEVAKEQKDGD